MRTQEERRHLDNVAVNRQLKIGKSMGVVAPDSESARQPHRLAKRHATETVATGHLAGNPRRSSTKSHEALTVHELSAVEAERFIERRELASMRDEPPAASLRSLL